MGFDKCVMTFSHHYSIIQRRQWHPTPVLLPGKSHGWRSLVGCSPWGCKELDMTEWLHFHFSLSCIGEGNGNPLHRSCLENPRDGGNPRGLLSMGSHRVGHDWSNLAGSKLCAEIRRFVSLINTKRLTIIFWARSKDWKMKAWRHGHLSVNVDTEWINI